jgi:hypothetical protein
VEEAVDAGVFHITPDINTENMITVDLQSQDFTPDDYATLDEAINAAVHTTRNMNTETMMAVDDLRSHNFSLGGCMSNTQDIDFKATDTWQRHGDISMTAMQTRPIGMPMSITVPREKEWDTGDFLGDDL